MTYIQKIYNFDYLVFAKNSLDLNQMQGVHLKFIKKLNHSPTKFPNIIEKM